MRYDISNDYIMTSPLSKFDNYTIYDIIGIQAELDDLISDNELDYNVKGKVCDRYHEVIEYIKTKIRERGENPNAY